MGFGAAETAFIVLSTSTFGADAAVLPSGPVKDVCGAVILPEPRLELPPVAEPPPTKPVLGLVEPVFWVSMPVGPTAHRDVVERQKINKKRPAAVFMCGTSKILYTYYRRIPCACHGP